MFGLSNSDILRFGLYLLSLGVGALTTFLTLRFRVTRVEERQGAHEKEDIAHHAAIKVHLSKADERIQRLEKESVSIHGDLKTLSTKLDARFDELLRTVNRIIDRN